MQNRNKIITAILLALGFFALPQRTQAVTPAPDGGYPGFNTAEGQNALLGLTTGQGNTAVGWLSLRSDITGSFNTAVGAGTLFANTADDNTATGVGALLSNNTGADNTANGTFALFSNTTGIANTGIGSGALESNTMGSFNTATGVTALALNATGSGNTANGVSALLKNMTGNGNTAIGRNALSNTTGSGNTALGANAGSALTTGDNNINIGTDVIGMAGDANTIRIGNPNVTRTFIRGISGNIAFGGATVYVESNGHLGTLTSSARFKDEIKPMDQASEAILALKPVTFHYKKDIDPKGIPQFGLVAEQVEKINPELVVRDTDGKAYTVRYEAVNAMLLNEFLKEHRRVEKLEATVAQQQTSFQSKLAEQEMQIQALASGLQKVSARVEMSKPATKVVSNHP
jgi:hypothetical protein